MAAPMVSMALDDEEQIDMPMPIPMEPPDFPPELRLCLIGATLEKLALDPSQAFVGGIVHGHFIAEVTSVGKDGPRIELQITDMGVESEDAENAAVDAAASAAPPRRLSYANTR